MKYYDKMKKNWTCSAAALALTLASCYIKQFMRLIVYIYIYIYKGTSNKILYYEKSQYFCHSFQKVKPTYYIDSLHRVKYFKALFLEILIMAYRY